jgi:C-terminal processing protease CtpA/Prc
MFAAPLVTLVFGVLPQAGATSGEKVRQDAGITLNYTDLSDADADAIVATVRLAREMLNKAYADVHLDPQVRLRTIPGAKRVYWTEGEDRIFFDFPNNRFYLNAQVGEDRILRFALPALAQLWLARSVTSSAGLDPRILDSLVEYADYNFRAVVMPQTPPPAPPTGPGRMWLQFEQIYPGVPAFVLNLLTTQKLPGHLVGDFLRRSAVEATQDPKVARLFDAICPPEPLLAAKDVEPSATLTPDSLLRRSRVTLFNGVPVLEAIGDPIAPNDRLADFENVFEFATSIEPADVVADPPTVAGQDLAKLYFEFRSRILRARDNIDFILTLREFLGRFGDRSLSLGPTQKMPRPPGQPQWFSVYGIGVAQNGTRIFVRKITAGSPPEAAGIKAGMELLAIDGRPAELTQELLVDVSRTFDSVPSEQRARVDALANLLSGPDGSEVELTFAAPKKEAADSGTWPVKLKRGPRPKPAEGSAVPAAPAAAILDSALRPDSIGVITIHEFPGDALKLFAAALDDLVKKGAKGLVIDLRGNEGQHDLRAKSAPIAKAALERLMPKEMAPTAIGAELSRTRESFLPKPLVQIVLQPQPTAAAFDGPVAVLIDAWTGGEAELFAMGIQATKRGQLLGTRTAGSVTLPKDFEDFQALRRARVIVSLPGRALVRPGGERVQGIGIPPNVEIVPTQEELAQGRDAVLDRAVALLKR